MASITSAGVGSGIDVESIITGLMEAESAPLTTYEEKKDDYNVQISAYGTVKSDLSTLSDLAADLGDSTEFGRFIASSSDEDVFTATAETGAINEEHEIEVQSLAVAHRMTSTAYADSSAAVGTGSYTFSYGSTSFDVTIDGTNNSLEGLRNAINDSAENDGISASIINVDGGSRLVLTAKEAGTENAITAPAMFSELTAAEDAVIVVDGFTSTSSSNSISDVIPGVTIELNSIGTAQLSTERDTESLKEQMQSFVEQYNSVISSMDSLDSDTLMSNFETQLRSVFFQDITLPNGETRNAFDLGFTFDKDGVLSIDDDVISELSSSDLESFVSAFTDTDNGFGTRIEDVIDVYTVTGGLIDNRTSSLNSSISYIEDQIERFEWRMEQVEERYRRQFTAMDTLVSELQTASDYMTSQLSSLS
ncbi:flagellar filament capping protein FliD [Granulosicoccaceae sp. 1_MG-2023]|nr:flagellar filament capping protein FliD [Granulosicoccaceae sp. 1_MG-2023]